MARTPEGAPEGYQHKRGERFATVPGRGRGRRIKVEPEGPFIKLTPKQEERAFKDSKYRATVIEAMEQIADPAGQRHIELAKKGFRGTYSDEDNLVQNVTPVVLSVTHDIDLIEESIGPTRTGMVTHKENRFSATLPELKKKKRRKLKKAVRKAVERAGFKDSKSVVIFEPERIIVDDGALLGISDGGKQLVDGARVEEITYRLDHPMQIDKTNPIQIVSLGVVDVRTPSSES